MQELNDERGRVEGLRQHIAALDQKLAARAAEADLLGRRAQDLEERLTAHSRMLARSEAEMAHLRAELESARKLEAELRATIGEITDRAAAAQEAFNADKARLQSEIDRAAEDRARLSGEIANAQREREKAAATERAENALLRERISDVAAEVARLASTLEGPNSPIDEMLVGQKLASRVNNNGPAVGGDTEKPSKDDGNLADRIRALQSASRRPASRNN
jgi:chromosome segregation ATPase